MEFTNLHEFTMEVHWDFELSHMHGKSMNQLAPYMMRWDSGIFNGLHGG